MGSKGTRMSEMSLQCQDINTDVAGLNELKSRVITLKIKLRLLLKLSL